MENKYYTPKIEEFHIGFEYELLVEGIYISTKFCIDHGSPYSFDDVEDLIKTSRVKYLDQEDIEDLGFEFENKITSREVDYLTYHLEQIQTGLFTLRYAFGDKNFWMEDGPVLLIRIGEGTVFHGRCKNKSELKRILKQVGYEEQKTS